MNSSDCNGRTPLTADTRRPTRLGGETLVDLAVAKDLGAGNETGLPRIRFLASRPGAEPVDLTALVLPAVLNIVEIIFLVSSEAGDLDKVILVGATDQFEVVRTNIGVRCQYQSGTMPPDVRYLAVKPHLRA